MFRTKHIRFCLIFLVFIFLFAAGQSIAASKKPLTWGTTPSTSGVFGYYVFTSKMLNDNIPDINITVRSTGGVLNLQLLGKKEVDIGSAPTTNAWQFVNGKKNFEGKPHPDLRLLYVIQTNGLQMVVSAKSGIKTVYDLEGKKYSPGSVSGGITQYVKDIFRILGIHPELRYMNYSDAIEQMKNEQIDGMAKMGVPDSVVLNIASKMKIRILSFSDEDLDKIVKNTVGLRKAEYPAGAYTGIDGFKTVDNEWSDFVNKDFSTDIAYKIIKTLWEHRAEIKAADNRFLGDDFLKVTLGVTTHYLHPGTIKFCRELGLNIPERVIPPEMK